MIHIHVLFTVRINDYVEDMRIRCKFLSRNKYRRCSYGRVHVFILD